MRGRPTEFDPKYIDMIYEYLDGAVPENMEIPTVEGIALRLGITKKTLYNWSKKNKDLLHALRVLKMRQKEELVKIGIFGGKEINANIVALLLKVNHKMIETQKADITSKGKSISPVLVKFISNEDDQHTD